MEDDAAILWRSLTAPDRFAELFHRHAGAIGRYLARRIGQQDAEDVLADTFLEAFRERDRYDFRRTDARPWLYGIATHRLGRYRRTERKQLRILERTGVDPVPAAFTERSDARVDTGRAARRVAECLGRLPGGQRDALLLFTWAELTYDETAAALGIPVGTVRSRISRARRALRAALGDADPTAVDEEATHARPE
jgi:RNA polymerase sigma-70 factor (ECF subfamily)